MKSRKVFCLTSRPMQVNLYLVHPNSLHVTFKFSVITETLQIKTSRSWYIFWPCQVYYYTLTKRVLYSFMIKMVEHGCCTLTNIMSLANADLLVFVRC